jgi:hypothetical protein
MWDPRPVTTLWAFTACYRDSFTFTFIHLSVNDIVCLIFFIYIFLSDIKRSVEAVWVMGYLTTLRKNEPRNSTVAAAIPRAWSSPSITCCTHLSLTDLKTSYQSTATISGQFDPKLAGSVVENPFSSSSHPRGYTYGVRTNSVDWWR